MAQQRNSDERLIIVVLAGIAVLCIGGIILADAMKAPGNDALLTIGSLCVGALASRISQKAADEEKPTTGVQVKDTSHDLDDDFAVIGRAATKEIIAQAMRQMGVASADRVDDPKK